MSAAAQKLRVLIIEDNEDDAFLAVRALKRGGFDPDNNFERVDNRPDLLSALQRGAELDPLKGGWDIIISDYSMPQFTGLDALKIVQAHEESHSFDIPFIIISGNIGEETAVAAMKAGAHDYIMKGNLMRLPPAVERELREADGRREHRQAEKKAKRYYRALSAITECNKILVRATEESSLLQDICDLMIDPGGYKFCWIGMALSDPTKKIQPVAFAGDEGGYIDHLKISWDENLESGHGPGGIAIRTREAQVITDIRSDPAFFSARQQAVERGFASMIALPVYDETQVFGVIQVYSGEYGVFDRDEENLLKDLASDLGFGLKMMHVRKQRDQAEQELSESYIKTIEGWAKALEFRDVETHGHSNRVKDMTVEIAQVMGLDEEYLGHIRRGALLHDIGKMGIPDSILLKPGPLTPDEWEIMRKHPEIAYTLLSPIPFLQRALEIPYCHHEKWDGSGYPRGLKGEEIPLPARIFAIVDVWQALRSDRPYRMRWSKEQTLEYIREQGGKHFDPRVVEVFFEVVEHHDLGKD